MNSLLFTKLSEKRSTHAKVLMDYEYRGIWETAIKKYSDTAHFVYELLQNADDTKATWVEFTLEKDGLWFKHNGSVKFSVSDVDTVREDTEAGRLGHLNAITAIGNSTKIDEQKIGKFGIGFKAVFVYTATPRIYDDIFNFELENYIVPLPIPPNKKRKQGETWFYFPFNHAAKTKEEAYADIEGKLESLFQPVLFLTHLQKIKWSSEQKKGEYAKKTLKVEMFREIQASLVEVTHLEKGDDQKEHLWLFSTKVTHSTLKSSHDLAVGFFLLDQKELETGYQYDAFCFFPTKEDTKLGFIIQAPFLLTDSRENIKAGEPWNVEIMQLVANLAANAIPILKQIGVREKTYLLNDNILELIPYKENDYSEISSKTKISFRPFYNTILQKLKTEELLPGRKAKYFAKAKAYWASDPELAELFSDQQISVLMENPNAGWVFVSKGQKQLNQADKPLEAYISSIVADTLDPKKLLRRITAAFIEAQTDQWLLKFYAYLGGRKSLWDDKEKLALKRPILLNQHRKAVVPFDNEQTMPNIFLPANRVTSYDTIYKPFEEDKEALEFFKGLGLGEPDLRAEIFKTIIPQYNAEFNYDDADTLLLHFASFLNYYEGCPASAQSDYLGRLQEVSFIAAIDPGDPDTRFFCKPQEVYFSNNRLTAYFASASGIYLLDEDFYSEFIDSNKKDRFYAFLISLGVASTPKVKQVQQPVTAESKKQFGLQGYEISLTHTRQIIADKTLEGLEHAVKVITPELSVIIWDYLLVHLQGKTIANANALFLGLFTFWPKGYSYSRTETFTSTLALTLKKDKWLFDKEDKLVSATELKRETLNPIYNMEDPFAPLLLEFLAIENPDANLNLTVKQREAFLLGRKLLEEGVTLADLNEFINILAARKKAAANRPAPRNNSLKDEVEVDEVEIQKVLSSLGKGIKKKWDAGTTATPAKDVLPADPAPESVADQDEYSKPSVNLQKKIDNRKEQMEAEIEELTRIEKLTEQVNSAEKYSFIWFKALLELEYLSSAEANAEGRQISIQFAKVEKEEGTERTLVLKHPARYIPQSIEDIGDLQLKLYQDNEYKTVTVEVVSVKEYTLRAKLKRSADILDLDLSKINKIVIEIKNPVFILEELRKAFYRLSFDDNYNLQTSLTENIRFIFGPPGTGKTTFLAVNEIIPLMQKKEDVKVLVLTPTNKAADVLTKRIMEGMGTDESYNHWLLRFGNTADAELESSAVMVDRNFDIRTKPRNTTITTIARFAYDYFQPQDHEERLHLKAMQWDYIIIDEASMVTLAAIVYVLYQKPESFFIIAGDPFQIQPITQIEQWKDLNIYSIVQLDRFVNPVTIPHAYPVINLQKQYRAISSIGNVFSHFTYEGILEHHRTEAGQKPLNIPGLSFKDINIIKFPVSAFESIFKCKRLHKSNYQAYSVLFTVEFVKYLANCIAKTHNDKFRIGIICPYKAQATLIEKTLAHQHIENNRTEILVGTIHGFQGDECDIIIAVFNPPPSISNSPAMFLNKQNILNVAISRARDYLFVLMPDEYTPNIENLYKIKRIESLIHQHAANRLSVYKTETIETALFGSKTYLYENSFATSHQAVNVYSKPEKKYEVRCEEVAVDIQIKHEQLPAASVAIQTPSYTVAESDLLSSETAYEN